MRSQVKVGELRKSASRQYVDVLCRFARFGEVEPVAVLWSDGHRYDIDEVLGVEPVAKSGNKPGQQLWHVRFGGHETDIWLERSAIMAGEPERMRWWVRSSGD